MTKLLNRTNSHIEMRDAAKPCVLRLQGTFFDLPAKRFADLKSGIAAAKYQSIANDASILTSMDSAGLADLSELEKTARTTGTYFAVYAATGTVKTTLHDALFMT